VALQSCKKSFKFYIQITSKVIRGTFALWLMGSTVERYVIIVVVYKKTVILWHRHY
jgi:hypothetical protein